MDTHPLLVQDDSLHPDERTRYPAIRAGAFWAAVLLPFCALALLASGLSTTTEYVSFVSLVVVNLVALVAGHDYGSN